MGKRTPVWGILAGLALIVCIIAFSFHGSVGSTGGTDGTVTCDGEPMNFDDVCLHGSSRYDYAEQADFQTKNRDNSSSSTTIAVIAGILAVVFFIIDRSSAAKTLPAPRYPVSSVPYAPPTVRPTSRNLEAQAHLQIAQNHFDLSEFEDAIREYQAAQALDPANISIRDAILRATTRLQQTKR